MKGIIVKLFGRGNLYVKGHQDGYRKAHSQRPDVIAYTKRLEDFYHSHVNNCLSGKCTSVDCYRKIERPKP